MIHFYTSLSHYCMHFHFWQFHMIRRHLVCYISSCKYHKTIPKHLSTNVPAGWPFSGFQMQLVLTQVLDINHFKEMEFKWKTKYSNNFRKENLALLLPSAAPMLRTHITHGHNHVPFLFLCRQRWKATNVAHTPHPPDAQADEWFLGHCLSGTLVLILTPLACPTGPLHKCSTHTLVPETPYTHKYPPNATTDPPLTS